ncbi:MULTISPECIES: PEP-CTERM sorting domain-containing protein [unclassified Duganella]|uniref:PEP-CTERM sorting domain-containing protein n=1 Tax=unclassified Duganella TaxID=2636909 RepID=UPI000873D97E|nr:MULTISPECIES: PEP-CTERM sorting domain-containing protein [unclassified Duganella]OEZ55867.1 PEP-CTERM motif protein [Duganella sp. HH105]OEZ97150.1 PEP-CTERM motif protein [Duganella sp. HH101]
MKKLTFAVLCALGLSAQAAPVTSIPGGTVLPMPVLQYFGAGPQVLAPGVIWSSANNNSVYGYDAGYGFANNGFWAGMPMAGTNDSSSTMMLAFSQAVSGVGAFLNYAAPRDYGTATIAAYDSTFTLIESTTLTFLTNGGNNQGEFHGFMENTPSISYFTMTGAYIGATEFTVLAVPEPATYGMLLAGLGLVGMAARRRKT